MRTPLQGTIIRITLEVERGSENRSERALHLSDCSNSLFAEIRTTRQKRFVDVAKEQKSSGEDVFNTAFQSTQKVEASLAIPGYQTSFDVNLETTTASP